jgi:hypothetical protein
MLLSATVLTKHSQKFFNIMGVGFTCDDPLTGWVNMEKVGATVDDYDTLITAARDQRLTFKGFFNPDPSEEMSPVVFCAHEGEYVETTANWQGRPIAIVHKDGFPHPGNILEARDYFLAEKEICKVLGMGEAAYKQEPELNINGFTSQVLGNKALEELTEAVYASKVANCRTVERRLGNAFKYLQASLSLQQAVLTESTGREEKEHSKDEMGEAHNDG